MSLTAKTVVLDIASNWGDGTFTNIRSVDFWLNGSKITNLSTTNFSALTSSQYSTEYSAAKAFDTSLSKTGGALYTSWLTASGGWRQIRLICKFNNATDFDEIRINNGHNSGGSTVRGARNVIITITPDIYSTTTYNAAITNPTVIFNGEFAIHAATDTEDEQTLVLLNSTSVVGAGGALAGGSATVLIRTASVSFTGSGGALVGGTARVTSTLRLVLAVDGGAVAGGTSPCQFLLYVGGEVNQPVIDLSGIADTAVFSYGNIKAKLPTLSNSGVTPIYGTGELYVSRVRIDADTGASGSIKTQLPVLVSLAINSIRSVGNLSAKSSAISANTGSTGAVVQPETVVFSVGVNIIQASGDVSVTLSEISGVSLTHTLGQGRFVQKSPVIVADIGHEVNLTQDTPIVSGTAETVIIGRGAFDSPKSILSGISLGGSVGHGAIRVNGSIMSGAATSDGYAYGDVEPSTPSIFGTTYTSATVIGNITPVHPGIYGQTELGLTSDIIKYQRGCSAA